MKSNEPKEGLSAPRFITLPGNDELSRQGTKREYLTSYPASLLQGVGLNGLACLGRGALCGEENIHVFHRQRPAQQITLYFVAL